MQCVWSDWLQGYLCWLFFFLLMKLLDRIDWQDKIIGCEGERNTHNTRLQRTLTSVLTVTYANNCQEPAEHHFSLSFLWGHQLGRSIGYCGMLIANKPGDMYQLFTCSKQLTKQNLIIRNGKNPQHESLNTSNLFVHTYRKTDRYTFGINYWWQQQGIK